MSAKLFLVLATVLCIGIDAVEFCGTTSPFSTTVAAQSGANVFYWLVSRPNLTLSCFNAMSSNVAASALKFKVACADGAGQWTLLGDIGSQNFNGASYFACPAASGTFYVMVYNPTAASISFQSDGDLMMTTSHFFGGELKSALPKAAATASNFSYCMSSPFSYSGAAGISWYVRWFAMGTSLSLNCVTFSSGYSSQVFADIYVACSETMTSGKYTMLGKLPALGGARATGSFQCPMKGYFFLVLNAKFATTWTYGASGSIDNGPSVAGELFRGS